MSKERVRLAATFSSNQRGNASYDPTHSLPNPWAIGTATVINAGLVALLLLLGLHTTLRYPPALPVGSDIPLKPFTLFAPSIPHPAAGSSGGGDHSLTDPITGRMPKQAEMLIVPPQVPAIERPKLAVDSAIPLSVKLPDNPSLPNIGVNSSTVVKLDSGGPGGPSGIGTGSNRGDGPGGGPGAGPGSDRGAVYMPGVGGVSKPVLLVSPEAEFSDEARRQKYQGVCIVSIVVDAQGNPRNLRITRPLGMGLDEKALEAVRKYRFKPAMKDGKPVASFASVEVNFRMY